MMESAPTTEAVYQGVYTLYNNTNTVEQEKASKWLEQLQNSVSGDEKMIQNNNKKSRFACRTKKKKRKKYEICLIWNNKKPNHTFFYKHPKFSNTHLSFVRIDITPMCEHRFIHGKLPTNYYNKNVICIHAILPPKRCEIKSKIPSMNCRMRHMYRCVNR